MEKSNLIIIVLLFTSFLVRVIPSFIKINIKKEHLYILDEIFPISVFVSFSVYIVYSEYSLDPFAATLSLSLAAALFLVLRTGLISTTIISSALYYLV